MTNKEKFPFHGNDTPSIHEEESLSDKMIDSVIGKHFKHKDVKEFIEKILNDIEFYFDTDDMPYRKADIFEIITDRAGDKLI